MEFSRTQDSEYVCQWGVRDFFVRAIHARSRVMPAKCDPLAKIWTAAENRDSHNFQNFASKTNQLGLKWNESMLIRWNVYIHSFRAISFMGCRGHSVLPLVVRGCCCPDLQRLNSKKIFFQHGKKDSNVAQSITQQSIYPPLRTNRHWVITSSNVCAKKYTNVCAPKYKYIL